jgi:hypothetical protein
MVAQVGYSMVRRSGDRVTPCVVCTVHVETRSACFLVEPQTQGQRFVSGLVSKPLGRFLPVWRQNRQLRFDNLGLKITATVSWFGPQNHAGYSLSVVPQNRWRMQRGRGTHRDLAACFTCKQVGLGFSSLASRLVKA